MMLRKVNPCRKQYKIRRKTDVVQNGLFKYELGKTIEFFKRFRIGNSQKKQEQIPKRWEIPKMWGIDL